jgi:transketolase
MKPVEDFDAMGYALIFTGPIGAGIGAAVGWCIAEGTKPQPPPQQQP